MLEPAEVQANWLSLEPFVDCAISHSIGLERSDDIMWRCVNQDNCWMVGIVHDDQIVAVATLEKLDTSMGQCLHTITLAGEGMIFWLHDYIAMLQELAESWHCDLITMTGRQGWQRTLKEFGWNHLYTTMGKPICH